MIRDKHIKKYILSKLCKYINEDIRTISSSLVRKLLNKFVRDESVILFNGTLSGTIYARNENIYSVITSNRKLIDNLLHTDIRRIDVISYDLIFNFIFQITMETPFGVRLLKKNVFNVLLFDRPARLKTYPVSKSITSENNILKPEDEILKKINITKEVEKDHKISFNKIIDGEKRSVNQETGIVGNNVDHDLSDFEIEKNNNDVLLNILPTEIIKIRDLNKKNVRKLINIFIFIKKFIDHKTDSNITIDKFLNCLQEPTYNTDLIRDIHSVLIEGILQEVNVVGFSLYVKSIQDIIDGLLDDSNIEEIRKKNDIGLKSWKIKARVFLWDLQLKTQNRKIYLFYVMLSKKKNYETEEAVRVRLDLLEFFIACFCETQTYKKLIVNLEKDLEVHERIYQEIETNIKLNNEVKLANNGQIPQPHILDCEQKLLQDLKHVKLKIIYSPLKSELGTIDKASFKFVDGDVYSTTKKLTYLLRRNSLELIVACYKPKNTDEENTIKNLKGIIEAIYQ